MRIIDAEDLKRSIAVSALIDDQKTLEQIIDEQPTIEERKKGKWIDMGDFEQCSVCLGTRLKEVQTVYGKAIWLKTDYCPNCGADMRGREDE